MEHDAASNGVQSGGTTTHGPVRRATTSFQRGFQRGAESVRNKISRSSTTRKSHRDGARRRTARSKEKSCGYKMASGSDCKSYPTKASIIDVKKSGGTARCQHHIGKE